MTGAGTDDGGGGRMAVHGGRMTGTDDGGEVGRAADRVAGTLLGVAVGDALGAGYEFSSPPRGDAAMIGGGLGPWAPGEWTDDTQQTVALAECTATGAVDLDAVAQALLGWWASRPPDVGISTAAVLGSAARAVERPAAPVPTTPPAVPTHPR
jgi:ADP-ribosylglycohydrolase